MLTDCGRCALGGLPFPIHPVLAAHHGVGADTFHAVGMKLIAGRNLRDDDSWDAPRVVVVGVPGGAAIPLGVAFGAYSAQSPD
jgi:hypothetical protein